MSRKSDSVGKVVAVKGSVHAEGMQSGFRVLKLGSPVYTKDKITTGDDARVEVKFVDDTRLSQGENSDLTINNYVYSPESEQDSSLILNMFKGLFRTITGKMVKMNPNSFTIKTPLATLGIRGTTVNNYIGEDGETILIEDMTDGQIAVLRDAYGNIRFFNQNGLEIKLIDGEPAGFPFSSSDETNKFFDTEAPFFSDPLSFKPENPTQLDPRLPDTIDPPKASPLFQTVYQQTTKPFFHKSYFFHEILSKDNPGLFHQSDDGSHKPIFSTYFRPTGVVFSKNFITKLGAQEGFSGENQPVPIAKLAFFGGQLGIFSPQLPGFGGDHFFHVQGNQFFGGNQLFLNPELAGTGNDPGFYNQEFTDVFDSQFDAFFVDSFFGIRDDVRPKLPPPDFQPPVIVQGGNQSPPPLNPPLPGENIPLDPPLDPLPPPPPQPPPPQPGENWLGTVAADSHVGTIFADTLDGINAMDTLSGAAGDDIIYGGDGDDQLQGDLGQDTLYGQQDNDQIHGDGGADLLFGGLGLDQMWGDAGDDTLNGEDGNDQMWGGLGNDSISGGNDNDIIQGGDGADYIGGDAGNDLIIGDQSIELGDDSLFGGAGLDTLWGGMGNDSMVGGADADELNGESGQDTLFGNLGNDSLYGGPGDDAMDGQGGNDIVDGDFGNDVLKGDTGADTLTGGVGNDQLKGGGGIDSLVGGTGSDSFFFGDTGALGTEGVDVINDFTSLTDKIVIDSASLPDASVDFHQVFNSGSASPDYTIGTANDAFILYDNDPSPGIEVWELWYDDDASSISTSVEVAETGVNDISGGDIVII